MDDSMQPKVNSSFPPIVTAPSNEEQNESNEIIVGNNLVSSGSSDYSDESMDTVESDATNNLLPRSQEDIPREGIFYLLKYHGGDEGSLLAKLVVPITVTGLMELILSFMNVFALGQLGATELAAGSLGATFVNVTGFALFLGMNTAFDTLGSQSYSGSKDPFALGVVFQRSLLVNFLLTIPITFTWFFAENILLLLGQDPHISNLAGLYCMVNIPTVFLFPLMDNFRRFLAVQGLTTPPSIIFAIGVPLHVVFNYFFIIHPSTGMGVMGAAIANTCTFFIIDVMFFIYFKFFFVNEVWGGFSHKAMHSIPQFIRIGLPGIAMVCTDWWAWDLLTIISGWIGEKTLAAQSVIITTFLIFYQIPHGIGCGANARIGNLLGCQCPQLARLSSAVTQILGFTLTGCFALLTYLLRTEIALVITQDPEVVAIVKDVMLVVSFLVFADGAVTLSLGIFRGCGMQTTGAIILFMGYYVVGIPCGWYLAFYGVPGVTETGMGLVGLYFGLLLSLVIMLFICFFILARLDWDEQVARCMRRLKKAHSSPTKLPPGYGLLINEEEEVEEEQPLLV